LLYAALYYSITILYKFVLPPESQRFVNMKYNLLVCSTLYMPWVLNAGLQGVQVMGNFTYTLYTIILSNTLCCGYI